MLIHKFKYKRAYEAIPMPRVYNERPTTVSLYIRTLNYLAAANFTFYTFVTRV